MGSDLNWVKGSVFALNGRQTSKLEDKAYAQTRPGKWTAKPRARYAALRHSLWKMESESANRPWSKRI